MDFCGTSPIEIYTDGSCTGNPGKGGWGVHMCQGEATLDLCGDSLGADTTNNRMELTAVVEALWKIAQERFSGKITILSDSRYVIDGIQKWIVGWKRSGWKTANKTPVKNEDLWKTLDAAKDALPGTIVWKWVAGHSGNPGNVAADRLARRGAL
jgi:ribonuclease HI